MPEILIPAELKGEKGKKKVIMLANTGSELVVLTSDVAREIGPTFTSHTIELEVAGGVIIRGRPCAVEISVEDPKTKEVRSGIVKAVVIEGQKELLMGISALEKLGIMLNPRDGEFRLI